MAGSCERLRALCATRLPGRDPSPMGRANHEPAGEPTYGSFEASDSATITGDSQ
jgi:hypothetical protein